ncbi:unnamed protein product [Clonostachys rhizophaga]|uniref:Zn(2)-C6 fungal-type domain-containing protein n=1 Tax=Clonostachys rhizophaga TaxID=160324 RepID=A0A9N9YP74_9HYPO|nr:unnamed protein product [Clonostachys rhizophaga]
MAELRSRKGCANCKKQRRKCSEERPRCKGCVRRGVSCEYPMRLSTNNRPRKRTTRRQPSVSAVTSSSSLTSDIWPAAIGSHGASAVASQYQSARDDPVDLQQTFVRGQDLPSEGGSLKQGAECIPCATGPENGTDDDNEDNNRHYNNKTASPGYGADEIAEQRSPRWRSLLIANFPYSIDNDHDVITPDETILENHGWMLEDWSFERVNPESFNSLGERIAFTYWVNSLSSRMTARDSDSNPYRRLALLAGSSPVLLHTLIALATEYMYLHNRVAPEVVIKRHQKAMRLLREALEPSQSAMVAQTAAGLNQDESVLAAVLMQVTNAVFTGGPGVEAHLRSARYFMERQGYFERPQDEFFPRMMVQRFAVLDVTIALLRHRRPYSPPNLWFFSANDHYDQTCPSFCDMTGCAQPVLVFLTRIAFLAADLDEEGIDEADALDEGLMLEMEMRNYAHSNGQACENRPESHLDTLSQCFYWAAHLILQRAVFRDSPYSRRVQHTLSILTNLIKSMPLGCGPDTSLSFPFYITAREYISEEQREWARKRNQDIKRIYPGHCRTTLMALLEEIWAAMDDYSRTTSSQASTLDEITSALERTRDFCII